DTRRQLVFDYAEEKYGKEHVARLGTVGLFRPKSALNQAGVALRIPEWMISKVTDSIIDRSSGDSRAMLALEDTFNQTDAGKRLMKDYPEARMVSRMEGHPNIASQHAAGIVLTQEPVHRYVAVDQRSKSVMCDKKDAEDLNLLKIDALGLTQLSIFERTLQMIGKPDKSGWLESIPLNDKKAFEVLNRGHFAGIFQFNGKSLQILTREVKINSIDDIISITALGRPGPIAAGGAGSWVRRKNGEEKITHIHPALAELTEETFGVVVYQETVMNIVRTIGKLSWEDTSTIRKAMSKSLGDEFFEAFWQKFKVGAKDQGIEEDTARKIWEQVNRMGSWSFNKSHAVAYGMVSYWCCYLKAHHPVEFAAATLDTEHDAQKQIKMLRELRDEGVDYVPVDPEHSTDRWEVKKTGKKKLLVGPLTQIKGIGPAVVNEILSNRKRGEPLRAALEKRLAGAVTEIDTLFPVRDAIKRVCPDLTRRNIHSQPVPINKVQCGINGEVMIIGILFRIAPRDENEAINVQRRGYAVRGPHHSLNMFFRDDTDDIFCKIDRFKFEVIGQPIIDHGRAGKALYAVKGTVPRKGLRMISVNAIRYLGDTDEYYGNEKGGGHVGSSENEKVHSTEP
ncbi:MAG: hypothetical protein MN733_33185, partial [Nitrososphaera sp.]|nr:hypothetical protein [Nitrososphaera sp.]